MIINQARQKNAGDEQGERTHGHRGHLRLRQTPIGCYGNISIVIERV